jgi:carboxylesterase
MTEVLQGAEPFSASGGPNGALIVHGFTGSPQSMRPLAEAFAAAGYTVELPLLPGHGTTVEDMLTTSWADWSAAIEAAYQDLARRCERVVVAGLSMGGTLTVWLAVNHPEIAAIVPINAAVSLDPDLAAGVQSLVDAGQEVMDAIGNDVADPEVTELAYDKTPLRPLLSLAGAIGDIAAGLPTIRCPTLVIVSEQDHVVPPQSSEMIANSVGGPVEVLRLERSYHVATIDFDRDRINQAAVAFADRAVSAAR